MLKKLILVLACALSFGLAQAADVNSASEADLIAVKGIGPAKAKSIIENRKKSPFKSWDDLISRIPGIGEKTALNMSKAGVTVGGQTYAMPADAKKAASAGKSAPAAPAAPAAKVKAAPTAAASASASAKK